MGSRILLTGFRFTSSEWLILASRGCDTLLLPNHRQLDAELLASKLSANSYDLVICTGQKPNIKDKICIETNATEKGITLRTVVDCQKLARLFEGCGMSAKISNYAGSSFCNALYYNGLDFTASQGLKCGLIFIHIPFLKNMTNPELFCRCLYDAIDKVKEEGAKDLWTR